jgi:hypothetical protein
MPHSDKTLGGWIKGQLGIRQAARFLEVVDVGAGAGDARNFYRPIMPDARWIAIEVWEPYITRFGLPGLYDEIIVADARYLEALPEADLYLFCDVLEHMPAADAVQLWDAARLVSRWLVIGLPVLDYPQGPVDGNPYEAHLHQWDMASVEESFAGIVASSGPRPDLAPGTTVGAFIAEGLRP